MRYIIRFFAFLGICVSLAHCGYLGSDALCTLFGTPRLEYGMPFDLATLALGLVCFAIGWRQKHDFAFWTGAVLDVLITALAASYLLGAKSMLDGTPLGPGTAAAAIALLTFLAGTHALFELGRTLIDFRRPARLAA